MDVVATPLRGVVLLKGRVFTDARGTFRETWREKEYADVGLPERFVQDNASRSVRGVLRGLHLQEPFAQGKLVSALHGEVWDVAVDLRVDSDTFGRWFGTPLSAENGHQLYVPPGLAHGFVVLSAEAVVSYKCTEVYHPEAELTLRWDDPDVGIEWPIGAPIVSEKDRDGRSLRELRPGVFARAGSSTRHEG